MKKNQLSFLIISIISILVLIFLGYIYFLNQQSESLDDAVTINEKIEQGLELCADIRGEITERQDCYFQLAVEMGNVVCDKMDEVKKGVFGIMDTKNCYEHLAINNQDYSICNLQQTNQEKKDECIWTYVFHTSDYSACDVIITNPFKDGCYSVVSLRTQDSSWCNKIISPSEKEKCLTIISLLE